MGEDFFRKKKLGGEDFFTTKFENPNFDFSKRKSITFHKAVFGRNEKWGLKDFFQTLGG